MLVLTSALVEPLMPAQEWVDQVSRAYVEFSTGDAVSPLRHRFTLAPLSEARLAFMSGFVPDVEALGCKIVGYYPGNAARGRPSVEGIVVLVDPETGSPVALIDGARLTELRTGAIVAAAVQHLSRCGATEIGLFGSGTMARSSLRMLSDTCGLQRVHVYSRAPARREEFAREMSERYGLPVHARDAPEEVLAAAKVIVCATATKTPVFPGSHLQKGSLVISIGGNTPDTRELDEETILSSVLVVESREATLAECGEVMIPIRAGRCGSDVIRAEIGEIIAGSHPRPTEGETIVLKSTGIAVQDLVIARELVRRAEAAGVGQRIDFE